MRTPNISQNNLNNYSKQQNFGMVTIAGSKISVDHLFKEGSGSSQKVFRLIREAGCSDSDVATATHSAIRGLAIMDEFSPVKTDIALGPKPETLLIKMSRGDWDEAVRVVDLSLDGIIEGASVREKNLTPGYTKKLIFDINTKANVLPPDLPAELYDEFFSKPPTEFSSELYHQIRAEKNKLKELVHIMPPISQEVGFRFSKAYSFLRQSLGFRSY